MSDEVIVVGKIVRPERVNCFFHKDRNALVMIAERIPVCEECTRTAAYQLIQRLEETHEPIEAAEFPHGEFPNIYSYRESAYPEDE